MEKTPYVKEFSELENVKYEHDKAQRLLDNLEKNYERRKKLNLLDDYSERELRDEIRVAKDSLAQLKRKYRSMESQQHRTSITERKLDLGKKGLF